MLQRHRWPGNVRELEHAIERAVIVATDSQIQAADLPAALRDAEPSLAHDDAIPAHHTLEEIERMAILRTLERTQWNKRAAATHSRRLPSDALQQAEEVQPAEAPGAGRHAYKLVTKGHPFVERQTSDPDRSTDAYLRHIAHDLRASLNVVVSWGELVKAGRLSPEDLVRAGDTIVGHTRHLSQRLSDALDVWRLNLGGLDVRTRPSAVGEIVRSAVDRARPQIERRRVGCAVALRADATAEVDPLRVAQALAVLLENAAAQTAPDQQVEVSLDVQDRRPVVAYRRGWAPARRDGVCPHSVGAPGQRSRAPV